MKKVFTTAFIVIAGMLAAQDEHPPVIRDTSWKVTGFFGLNGAQTALNNWQGGGQSSQAFGMIFNVEVRYRRDDFEYWTNKLDAQFGMIRPGDGAKLRKNLDQLFFISKYNTKAFGKHWFWTAQADYRTQFAPGYKFAGDSIQGRAVSDFNSPGYIQLALGLDYKPRDYFSITFAPIAGKITLVNRQYLADQGAFGVDKAVRDSSGRILTPGKKVRYEVGGRVIMRFRKDITKNLMLDSYLDLFSNYQHNPQNIDVIFNNTIAMKITRFLTINFTSQMLYDDDVVILRDWNKDGEYNTPGDIQGPRLQALSTISIGFSYKF